MQGALLVGVLDRQGDGVDPAHGLLRRQRIIADQVRQAPALDEIHAEIVLTVVLADFVDGDDVGVLQASGGLGLQAEAIVVGGTGQLAGEDHLEGDDAIELTPAGPGRRRPCRRGRFPPSARNRRRWAARAAAWGRRRRWAGRFPSSRRWGLAFAPDAGAAWVPSFPKADRPWS